MSVDLVYLDLFSANDGLSPGALTAVGAAFDADPNLRPERMDTGDPIRVKIESAEAYLAEIESTTPRPLRVAFQRRKKPEFVGDLDTRDGTAQPLPGLRRLWLASGQMAWLETPANADAFADLVVRLAGAFDAAYGFATHSKLPGQQRVEFAMAAHRGEPSAAEPGPSSDRHSLRDVFWLNVYGPAFVERFGERLAGLGVRQERTSNGGLVIWAAPSPFLHDPEVRSHRDYPWKQPFYEALGPDAFVRPLQGSTGNVPSPEDHRRFVRGQGS